MRIEQDVATYLEAQSMGTVWNGSAGDIFITRSQDTPDDQVIVRAYGGRSSDMAFGPVDAIRYPRFQIEARAKSSLDADAKIEEIRNLFPAAFEIQDPPPVIGPIPPPRQVYARPVSEPIPLGPDSNNRWRTVCNFEAAIAV